MIDDQINSSVGCCFLYTQFIAGSCGLVYIQDYCAISCEYGWIARQRCAVLTRPLEIDAGQRMEQNRSTAVPRSISCWKSRVTLAQRNKRKCCCSHLINVALICCKQAALIVSLTHTPFSTHSLTQSRRHAHTLLLLFNKAKDLI